MSQLQRGGHGAAEGRPRAEWGHLVCYSWNSGCPCHSERAAALQGHCHSTSQSLLPPWLCPVYLPGGARRQSLSERRERTVAAGHSTHRVLSSALLCAWRLLRLLPWSVTHALLGLGTGSSSAQSQTSGSSLYRKHGSHPGPALPKCGKCCVPKGTHVPGYWSRPAVLPH